MPSPHFPASSIFRSRVPDAPSTKPLPGEDILQPTPSGEPRLFNLWIRGNKYGMYRDDCPSLLLPSLQRSLDLPAMDSTKEQSPDVSKSPVGSPKSPLGSPGKHQASKSPSASPGKERASKSPEQQRSPSSASGGLLPGDYWTEAAPLVQSILGERRPTRSSILTMRTGRKMKMTRDLKTSPARRLP